MTNPNFRIIAYVTEEMDPARIRYNRLTHINYAFLIPNRDGSFRELGNPGTLEQIVRGAHLAGVKVLISVGGWGWNDEFNAFAADPQQRAGAVERLVKFVERFELDGVDMDWEYPDPGVSSHNFLALMQELRSVLPQDKLLTAAVVALGDLHGLGTPEASFALMDFVNIMTYDGEGPHHSSMEYAVDGLKYWRGRGVPRDKAVLGVPFYARPVGVPYSQLVEADAQAAGKDFICHNGELVNYNGIPTMQAKTRLALREGSGIMFWTLNHDVEGEASLLEAIWGVLQE